MNTIFKIFKEIIEQDWCKIEDESKRVEQAIKTALVLNTEGVVVAPLDGVPRILINRNPDGSKYIDIYYAGPIRAAGGTSAVLPLILGDYARELLNLDRYKPTEDEVERYVEECDIYDDIVSRQYKLTEDEVKKIIRGCSVCINGEPTEEREVSANRNIPRIPHNRVRGGMCLVISEGVAQKARKILKYAEMLNLDWTWLEGIIKVEKSELQTEIKPSWKYLEGIAAGRPIFSYPSRPGGFRLRYGRSRGTGIMAKAVHPATMFLLDEFIAIGTQIKVERPGKAAGISACDSIEGPIAKLINGDVVKLNTVKEVEEVKQQVKQILFLGDILIPYGDFRHSAHPLIPVGYCEEWWRKELEKLEGGKHKFLDKNLNVSFTDALELTKKGLALYPKFLNYYNIINKKELGKLFIALKNSERKENKIKLKTDAIIKEILETIGLEHKNREGFVIEGEQAEALIATFGLENHSEEQGLKVIEESENVLAALSSLSGFDVKDKGGSFIGTRMGRPESSSPRQVKGNPHALFPIGNYGGATRSMNKAMMFEDTGIIEVEVAAYKIPDEDGVITFPFKNGKRSVKVNVCFDCGKETLEERCRKCGGDAKPFSLRKINLNEIMTNAGKNLGIKVPHLVKGVREVISASKICEPIEKGLLRAKHDLHIFRDGTIRYELINNPLTHFKAKEIGISLEKLKELGYEKDAEGKEISNEEQVIELFPQDIIVHEDSGDFFVKVTKFIDEELEKFYKLPAYYNANSREDLIGEIVLGLAPHTSAAIVARILGYTKSRGCFAHPFFHQTKRRNADGDQDSIMLLLDGLLNFSQAYLPSTRGGRMDAPIVFTVALNPNEIDDEVYSMEVCKEYPLELYELAQKNAPPEINSIERVEHRLGKEGQYSGFGYTHETTAFDLGPSKSRYVQLNSMEEKIKAQAKLQYRIKAVDGKDSIERVLISHFLPDIIGNTRAFSRQKFRCSNCNASYRRIPLIGDCRKCDKGNLILTVSQGSVRKYLDMAMEIINEYDLSPYLKQRIELIGEEIDSVFTNDLVTQKSLSEFMWIKN